MNAELKLALRQMGYRHMGDGVWGKPVAYHLFTVKMEGAEAAFTNYFRGVKKVLVWDRHVLNGKDYEDSLKLAEYATRAEVGLPFTGSAFGFVTPEERYADIL